MHVRSNSPLTLASACLRSTKPTPPPSTPPHSWLSKLDLIKSLLVDRSPMMRPGLDEMAFCYIYATWINTGAIMCAESGGHHRPNHHSNLALQMFR